MRRLLIASLVISVATAFPSSVESQSIVSSSTSLAGTREVGLLLTGRLLSTEYSTEDGRAAFGGTVTFGTHLRPTIAIQLLQAPAVDVHADDFTDLPALDGRRSPAIRTCRGRV